MKVVRGYIHHDGSIGVLARFEVGSDFTARTPEFKEFSDSALMSIAAYWRDAMGEGCTPSTDVTEQNAIPWVGSGESATLGEALEAASKVFREKISIESVSYMSDEVDRRPREVRDRAARGCH